MLLLTNTANAQVQNDVNLLPDTGNVGIGTASPTQKLQVNGNSLLDGTVSVTDSLSVGSKVSVGSSLIVADSMTVGKSLSVRDSVVVGSSIRTEKNLYVADTLKVGGVLEVDTISNVKLIAADKITAGALTGINGEILLNDPLNPDPECTNMKINYCDRRIFGYKQLIDGTESFYGVGIGVNAKTSYEHSFAAGNGPWAAANSSIALGYHTRALGEKSIIIGSSPQETTYFNNNIDNSLMIGFNIANNTPSLFVGPSTIANLPGNVGIGTKTPEDKFVIGENMERISFGSAFNDGFGWSTGYIGMNYTRTRTDGQASVWTASANPNNNGGFVISTGANGIVYFIPVATTGGSALTMTDEELFGMRMIELHPEKTNSWAGGPAEAFMKVNGKIWCKEIEVKIDPAFWWDDVFAPGYKMRTFEELQDYIALNGHLPDVPSETEVTENGLSLGEGYGTLLRKIEELTLYMLELKKENEELRQMIEEKESN